jgi:hypothetical protein
LSLALLPLDVMALIITWQATGVSVRVKVGLAVMVGVALGVALLLGLGVAVKVGEGVDVLVGVAVGSTWVTPKVAGAVSLLLTVRSTTAPSTSAVWLI